MGGAGGRGGRIDRTENNILSILSPRGLRNICVRARNCRSRGVTLYSRMKESRARRVCVKEGWWTSGPRIEEEWEIEATRLHPSDDGPASDTRDSNLPTTFRMHYLLSSTHAYHLNDSFLIRFRAISHKSFFYRTFRIVLKFPSEERVASESKGLRLATIKRDYRFNLLILSGTNEGLTSQAPRTLMTH